MTVLIVVAIVVVVIAIAVFVAVKRPRQDEGMSSFRRHIDALSPEARREVQERARRHDENER